MSKKLKIFIGILFFLWIAIIAIDASRPKPVDWTETYKIKDKKPFGLYIFDNECDTYFNPQSVTRFGKSPYEFLDAKYRYKDSSYSVSGTVLYIDNKFDIDDESLKELMYFASHGNSIFLSSFDFPKILHDSLHFKISYGNIFSDTLQLEVQNAKKEKNYFDKGTNNSYFIEIDSARTTVLGKQKYGKNFKNEQTNFIKVPFGEGAFYLHTQPEAFTNYYMLKNQSYAESILNNIPQKDPIFWKVDRYESENLDQSPLRFIFSEPSLKWAWLFALLSMIFFMIFNAKRRQRVVPVIEPLKNTTVEFTKTIGNLYYQEKNHLDIIEKKIKYLLEKIRNEYYIDTFNLDDSFIKRLHQKTSKNIDDIAKLVHHINQLRRQTQATEADIIKLNELIEKLNL
ncbi:DUF4350 domain-containing protein [Flavobacterium sp. NRK F10]|uniref:DUF4350 domain-containing protein n=1 Tax=Flavobacterium sp. NRK F10 TaxID=2954931 RepID=UPI00209094F4|nr:DUF4350 domain-containing protein [Flavobacterium sp. NRK F10]MCO6173758.1 DUF4350 domain-containing protein [Flavobacterium sp. NRK F10]